MIQSKIVQSKIITAVLFLFINTSMIFSQTIIEELPVWPDKIPLDNGITEESAIVDNHAKTNTTVPKMTVYLSEDTGKQTDKAMLICPGGGYARQAIFHEGHEFASWLAKEGIAAAVLEYRLPNKHHEIPLLDAKQAIGTLRSTFFKDKKIGVSGFSAGGHLAATLGTLFDKKILPNEQEPENCRPDFMVLFYPVITMDESFTHLGSRNNLLGENPAQALVDYYSAEKQVTPQTPPALLFLSDDDKAVVPENSIEFYAALKKNNIPASMYIFPVGGHGWGMRTSFAYHETWKSLLVDWLNGLKVE